MSTSGDERSTPDAGPPCGHVFVSHSHDDRAVAGRLVHRLEGHGIKCWIAPRDIRPGEDWAAALAEAVETASALVFLLSATSAESSHCAKELDLAQGAGVAQVPVRLDATPLSGGLKYRLSGRHWLDISDDEEAWVDALADVLEPGRRTPVATVPSSPPSQRPGETPHVDGTVTSTTSGTKRPRRAALYRGFWTRYLDRVWREHPDWTKARSPSDKHWMSAAGPIPGTLLMPVFRSGGRIGHDLYIDTGDPAGSRELFDQLDALRSPIEAAYGGPLEWLPIEGKRACRIADNSSGSIDQLERHDEFIDWFIDRGVRLRQALGQHAEGLGA